MNILVTGAFGGVGTPVLDAGLARGYAMSVFELNNKRNRKKAAMYENRLENIFWGDLRNHIDVGTAVSGQDAVIHLGAIIPPLSEKNPELSYAVNVDGTKNIVKAVGDTERDIKLVFASSMSVMGASSDRKPPLRIGDPVRAASHYTSQKIECERLLQDSKISWTIARLGAVINTEMSAGGGSLKEMMDEVFAMSLENRIEGIWSIDAAEALINAVGLMSVSDVVNGKIFFLGGGARNGWQLTVREFYSGIFRAVGIGMLDEKRFSKEPYYADWLDTEESQKLLEYQKHTFEEFLLAMRKKMKIKRFFARVFAPVIRSYFERPAWSGEPG